MFVIYSKADLLYVSDFSRGRTFWTTDIKEAWKFPSKGKAKAVCDAVKAEDDSVVVRRLKDEG